MFLLVILLLSVFSPSCLLCLSSSDPLFLCVFPLYSCRSTRLPGVLLGSCKDRERESWWWESHHSFPSLTYSSDMPASLSVGHNSGSAWVSVSPDPLLCIHYFLSLWFSPTIKYESELAKLKVFDISWSWLSTFSYLTVICCRPLMWRWPSWDFCGCPMRSRTHFWSFWFCRWLLCYVSVHVALSFFRIWKGENFEGKKISNGFLKCFAFLPADCNVFFSTVLNQ